MISGFDRLEKIVGKEENASYFQKPLCQGLYFFATLSRLLTTLYENPLENIVRKEDIAGNQHFLPFPQCFLIIPKQISNIQIHLYCSLQMLSIWIWTRLKFCFDNTVRKGENTDYQDFLLFPQCFLSFPIQISVLESHLQCQIKKDKLSNPPPQLKSILSILEALRTHFLEARISLFSVEKYSDHSILHLNSSPARVAQ